MKPSFPRLYRALLTGSVLLLAALPARAEEPSPFQVALHAGYRVGGSLEDETTGEDRDFDEGASFALALELRYKPGDDRFYQLWYSRQESEVSDALASYDVDIEYLHLGGTIPIGDRERAQPYFAAGLGAHAVLVVGTGRQRRDALLGLDRFRRRGAARGARGIALRGARLR